MLKRKDGRWQEQIKLPGMDKPKYFYGKTQREVKQKMAAWNKEQDEEKELAVLFETVADEWENWHTEQVGWGTAQNYRKSVAVAKEWFAGRNINDIYTDEIVTYLESVAKRGYKKKTVQHRKSALCMIWDYAIRKRIVKYNVARTAPLPKGLESTEREAPTEEEMKKIKAGFSLPFGMFAMIQCYTGMRRGELLALTWEDIDTEKNIIHVTKAVEFIGGSPHIKDPKTSSGKRDIILLDALKEHLPSGKRGIIFPGKAGGYMQASEYRTQWGDWCCAIGLGIKRKADGGNELEITSHQMRHAYASMLYDAGVGAKDAQELMGHADVQTTLNIYTHIGKSRKQATAERLNKFLCQKTVEHEKDE